MLRTTLRFRRKERHRAGLAEDVCEGARHESPLCVHSHLESLCVSPGAPPAPQAGVHALSTLISLCGSHIHPGNQAASVHPGKERPYPEYDPLEIVGSPIPVTGPCRGRWLQRRTDLNPAGFQATGQPSPLGYFKSHKQMTSLDYFPFTGGQWKEEPEMLLGTRRICWWPRAPASDRPTKSTGTSGRRIFVDAWSGGPGG